MQNFNENQAQQNPIKLLDNISYKFDLDYAQLSAGISIPDERFNSANRCHLQLWACDTPHQGNHLLGIKIAEAAFIPEYKDAAIFDNVPVKPPAGNRDFAMVMALVSEDQSGRQLIEDYINFSQRQQFVQPRFGAIIETHFDTDGVDIVIDYIENPREQHNLSGDLCLEIWATNTPYSGSGINGTWLAGLNIGQLVGGELRALDNYRFLLDQTQLPAGSHLVLLLREWSTNGFVTRDFRHLTQREQQASAENPLPADPVIAATTSAAPIVAIKNVSTAKPSAKLSKSKTPDDKPKAASTTSRSRKKKNDLEAGSVSVNAASADELHTVKGISASVANSIVEQRPYEKIDDLVRVPGIGAKLLERIRKMLRL